MSRAHRPGCRSGSSRPSTWTRWRSRSGSRACASSPALERSGALAITRNGYLRLGHRALGHGGVRAERRGPADARRDGLSRARAGRPASADPGHGQRRPRGRPVRPERRVHRRSPVLRRARDRGRRPGRPRPPGHGARRLRPAPRRSESASDEPRRPRLRRRGQCRGRLGRTRRRPPRRPDRDPAATAPGTHRAPGRAARVRHAVGHGLRAVVRRRSAPTSATTGPAGSSPGCTPRRSSTTSWTPMPSFATPPTTTSSSSPSASRNACLGLADMRLGDVGPALAPRQPARSGGCRAGQCRS